MVVEDVYMDEVESMVHVGSKMVMVVGSKWLVEDSRIELAGYCGE